MLFTALVYRAAFGQTRKGVSASTYRAPAAMDFHVSQRTVEPAVSKLDAADEAWARDTAVAQ